MLCLLLFALCDHFAGESGLIAVTVMGIWLSLASLEVQLQGRESLKPEPLSPMAWPERV